MPVSNAEIGRLFLEYADLLEIGGANPFRVRAYRNAARTLADLPKRASVLVAQGADLSELPGIGKDLAGKIAEIVETGALADFEALKRQMPAELGELLALPGLGPKRVKLLYEQLGIRSLGELKRAIESGKLQGLPGFGEKSAQKLAEALKRRRETERRWLLAEAEQSAAPLVEHLKAVAGVRDVVIAGSYRRRRETVGDLDILVTCEKSAAVMSAFVDYDAVDEVVSKGTTRATVILRSGLQVDLRVVPKESYGAALYYFTGSKAHNIAVRGIAVKKGLKINEYGVFRGDKRIAGKTEKEVFAAVGLPYIEPELRENRGEIEAARAKRLPKLIALDDIKGDLHSHSTATDGRASIKAMAEAAKARGYAYLAITDHSRHVTMAHGLDAKRLRRQIAEIDRLNEELKGITILKSIEVDILEDGKLDLPDEVLKELDFTVCSLHYKLNLSAEKQTERVIRAMDNRYFTIFGHPSTRLIGSREPCALLMEKVMDAALERGCYLEVNGQPERLDLDDRNCRLVKERGLKVALSTDAHTTNTLDYMRFAVGQARRGWLEPEDVLNSRPLGALRKLLRRA